MKVLDWLQRYIYMSDGQFRLLAMGTGCYLLGSIGLWLMYALFLYLSGQA